jgi:hypothetical protein
MPAAVSFFAGLLDGAIVDEDEAAVELAWPGGGHMRLELHPDATPGFLRLEVERTGPTKTVDVSGAPVLLSPPSA